MKNKFDIDPWIPCSLCKAPMLVTNELFDKFFNNEKFRCIRCMNNIDIEEQIEYAIELNLMNNGLYHLLGLPSKIYTVILQKEKSKTINFSDFGIPEEAIIVYINYTTQNTDVSTVQVHGNVPYVNLPQKEVTLYPIPMSEKVENEIETSIMIMWSDNKDVEIKYLLDAINYFNMQKYDEMIIPLNIAIEAYITSVLFRHFQIVWNDKVASRLINSLDYSYILKKLLPDLVYANSWIELSKDL